MPSLGTIENKGLRGLLRVSLFRLCGSCVIVPVKQPVLTLRCQLQAPFELVHRRANVFTIGIGVPLYHRQCFVSADPLSGG